MVKPNNTKVTINLLTKTIVIIHKQTKIKKILANHINEPSDPSYSQQTILEDFFTN